MSCPLCGGRLLKVESNFFKCLICGSYLKSEEHLYTYGTRIKDVLSPAVISSETVGIEEITGLSRDQKIWVGRVAERLTQLKPHDDAETVARVLNVRAQFRKELTDCLMGNGDFNDWFDRTKSALSLHKMEFTRILYDSLEGLRDPECAELRKQYERAFQKMM